MVEICYKNVKKGLYKIDENGNVYSSYKKGYMKPSTDKDGYLKLGLSGGSREEKCYVRIATLVAWHYLGPPGEDLKDPTVNHIDGNVINNHYKNLEWIDRSKNSSIRENKGAGEKNSQTKLTKKEVHEICQLIIDTDLSLTEIAKLYNMTKGSISRIYQKKTWKSITEGYDFSCRVQTRNKKGQFELANIKFQDTGYV